MKKLAILAVSALVLTGCSSNFVLDSDSAARVLFSHRDFSFDLKAADEPLTIGETDLPVFGASDDCKPDIEIAKLISRQGNVLASLDAVSPDTEIYVHQDIVEFENVDSAVAFMELVRNGHGDSDCSYNSEDEYSSFVSSFEEIELAEDVFRVSGDESIIWLSNLEITAKTLKFSLKNSTVRVFMRKGSYVIALKGIVYEDADSSVRDVEKDFGRIVEQFLAGRPNE